MTGAPPTLPETADLRPDLALIADIVKPGARVLDIGCGDGALLYHLTRHCRVDGRGLEISRAGVEACLRRGVAVIQGNAETDLPNYPDQSFDYAVLSQTLQATHNPLAVLHQLVRIGRYGIVSFPNFGYWYCRWQLFRNGRMPVTGVLPLAWYETQNIHFCTIRDFLDTCRDNNLQIVQKLAVNGGHSRRGFWVSSAFANLFGQQGMFVLARAENS